MKYCKLCVLPDTRPNLYIRSDGICSACYLHKNKKKIKWKKQNKLFKNFK